MRELEVEQNTFRIQLPKVAWKSAVTKYGSEQDQEVAEEDGDSGSESEDDNDKGGLVQHDEPEDAGGSGDKDGSEEDEDLEEDENKQTALPARARRDVPVEDSTVCFTHFGRAGARG